MENFLNKVDTMKILMANKFLYPRAGAETYMLTLAEELMSHGHEVKFFGMEHPENYYPNKSICVKEINFSANNNVVKTLSNIVNTAIDTVSGTHKKNLNNFLTNYKPDIIHAHNIYNQISPRVFSSVIKKYPVVMTIHDFKPVCPSYNCFVNSATCTSCLTGKYYNCIIKKCVQKSLGKSILAAISAYYNKRMKTYKNCYSAYISPSVFLKELMVRSGINTDKIKVVKNIASGVKAFSSPGDSILYAGRLCEEKGVKTLIDAYSLLGSNSVPLKIAGSGPDEEYLKNYAKAKQVDVVWLGKIPPEKVKEELKNCLLTVTPSIWFENCSISILESLVSGRICIASDSGGNPELIEDEKNGWVFSAGNSHELYKCLKYALSISNEKVIKMSKYAYKNSNEKYSKIRHVGEVIKVYEELIDNYR